MKVFLGGTCNDSTWREELIQLLEIDYFNPVVEDWTPACMAKELEEREKCDICLYIITPKMTGVYSIAEAVDDSNKRPGKTVFCVLSQDENVVFDKFQLKSLASVQSMILANGAKSFDTIIDLAKYLNTK